MSDQVLNYSEPPFCRPLADADMLLLQFALICHTSVAGSAKSKDGGEEMDQTLAGLAFGGEGTLRLVVRNIVVRVLLNCLPKEAHIWCPSLY